MSLQNVFSQDDVAGQIIMLFEESAQFHVYNLLQVCRWSNCIFEQEARWEHLFCTTWPMEFVGIRPISPRTWKETFITRLSKGTVDWSRYPASNPGIILQDKQNFFTSIVIDKHRVCVGCSDHNIHLRAQYTASNASASCSGLSWSTLSGHTDVVYALAFWGPQWLASASGDNNIRVWDLSSGQCLAILHGHRDDVRTLATVRDPFGGEITQNCERGGDSAGFDPGPLISGSEDWTVRVWRRLADPDSPHQAWLFPCAITLRGHHGGVNGLALLNVDVLLGGGFMAVSAADDGEIKVWELGAAMAFSLTTDVDRRTAKAPADAAPPRHSIRAHRGPVTALAVFRARVPRGGSALSPSCAEAGLVFSAGSDGEVRAWSATDWTCLQILQPFAPGGPLGVKDGEGEEGGGIRRVYCLAVTGRELVAGTYVAPVGSGGGADVARELLVWRIAAGPPRGAGLAARRADGGRHGLATDGDGGGDGVSGRDGDTYRTRPLQPYGDGPGPLRMRVGGGRQDVVAVAAGRWEVWAVAGPLVLAWGGGTGESGLSSAADGSAGVG